MKSCPTCNRTYPDDTLAFCLMDGSVLSAPFDPDAGRIPAERSAPPPTKIISPFSKGAERSQPLQSTIRAPVPDIPALGTEPRTRHPAAQTQATVKNAHFAWLLGGRALVMVFFALASWASSSPIFATFENLGIFLGGLLTGVAGVMAQSAYKAGKILIVDAVLGVVASLAMTLLVASHNYVSFLHTKAGWEILTGALLIAAALELRRHVRGTVFLALAGVLLLLAGFRATILFISLS